MSESSGSKRVVPSVDISLEIARSVPDENARNWALEWIAETLARAGHLDRAREIGQEIEGGNRAGTMCARTLGNVATAAAHHGRFDESLALAALVTHPEERALALCAIARHTRQTDACWDAADAARCVQFGPSSARTLIEVARTWVQLGDLEVAASTASEAVRLTTTFRREKWAITPLAQAAAVLAAAGACGAATEELVRATRIMKEASDADYTDGGDDIIIGWFTVGLSPALKAAGELAWSYDRSLARQTIAHQLVLAGDLQQASTMIELIEDTDIRTATVGDFALGHARAGDHARAEQLLAAIAHSRERDRAACVLAIELATRGDMPRAHEVVTHIERADIAVDALIGIGHAHAATGATPEVEYREASNRNASIEHSNERDERSWRCAALLAQYAPADEIAGALVALGSTEDRCGDGMRMVAVALAERGLVTEALAAADRIAPEPLTSRNRSMAFAEVAGATCRVALRQPCSEAE